MNKSKSSASLHTCPKYEHISSNFHLLVYKSSPFYPSLPAYKTFYTAFWSSEISIMVRVLNLNHIQLDGAGWGSSMPLALGLFVSISALVALCAKGARRKQGKETSTKLERKPEVIPRSSPMASPRRIMETISNKASSNINSLMKKSKEESRDELHGEEGFGVWQNKILMGEKCKPLEFSGAIFYDNYGNRVSEMPKSPRANPMSSFSFPVVREESRA